MWISDVYLKMQIDTEQRQRLAEARCTHMTARAVTQRRLLLKLARVQHELDVTERRERVRRAETVGDCG